MKLTYYSQTISLGEVPEWFNGTVSKTVVPSPVPRVRIPPSPIIICPAGGQRDTLVGAAKTMLADYSQDPLLFQRCMNLINEVFPGCQEFALSGSKYNASWSEASTPFIVEQKGEIIAHAGVLPITLMLNEKEHHTAAIHAVCVKPEHRGKGHFKQLMQEVMPYLEANFDSSILFTEKPYLYKNYPYKIMLPEYDFVVTEKIKFNTNNSDLRILHLDNPADLKIVENLLFSRVPLSNQLSVFNKYGQSLFILNTMGRKIVYSEKLNTLIIFDITDGALYIKEIISSEQRNFSDVVELIPDHFEKIILQFCPDKFLDEKDYKATLAKPDSCMMVSDKFVFQGKHFRYPELYGC